VAEPLLASHTDVHDAIIALSIIIVNYQTPELVIACLKSLQAERSIFKDFHVTVVDGHSDDGSVDMISSYIQSAEVGTWVTLLPLSINGGFGYANNQALLILESQGQLAEKILLLNPDTIVSLNAITYLCVQIDEHDDIGIVGGQLLSEAGELMPSAFHFSSARTEFADASRTGFLRKLLFIKTPAEVEWVTGAAMMIRKRALEVAGLFNDQFFLYFEEVELTTRIRRAGFRVATSPEAHIIHLGGRATQIRDAVTNALIRKRLPRYWYESRRLYFLLTRGRAYAALAGVARALGYGVWVLRCLITFRENESSAQMGRDIIRFGIWKPGDWRTPPPRFGDLVGAEPAWMIAAKDRKPRHVRP
jgi:N-acetylglucosaminyl-diphospho-decaprenol L-rhamnosyltransferase